MAISHLQFGNSTTAASNLRSGLQQLESGRETLIKVLAQMATMLSGDGSSIAHFDEVVIRFGVNDYATGQAVTDAQRTVAKGLWDELNSCMAKLTTDASVSNVQAAILQLMNKTR